MHIYSRSLRSTVATAAVAAIAIAGLVACSSSSSGDGGTGTKEFTYWSMYTKDEPTAKVIQAGIASFEKDTGVQVHAQWQGRDVLTKVKAALNTNKVPDLVDQGFPGLKATLALSHQALDLKPVYDMAIPGENGKTVRDAVPTSYDSLTAADGKTIQVPYYISTNSIWYSAKQYPNLVKSPPTTWDEFTKTFAAVKANGQAPLAHDTDILDYDSTFVDAALERALGPGKLHDLVADHSGNGWDDPKVKSALGAIAQLAADKDYVPGYDSSKYPVMEKDWAHGKAAYIYMGSWVPQYDGPDVAKDYDMRTFNFPQLVGTDQSMPVTTYGYAVPSKAKNAPAAEKFIAYFLGRTWLTQLSQTALILTPDPTVAVPAVLKDLQTLMKTNAPYPADDGVSADFPDLSKQFDALNQGLITGKDDVDAYVSKAKSAQSQYWKLNG